jgi:hypothetical protein
MAHPIFAAILSGSHPEFTVCDLHRKCERSKLSVPARKFSKRKIMPKTVQKLAHCPFCKAVNPACESLPGSDNHQAQSG